MSQTRSGAVDEVGSLTPTVEANVCSIYGGWMLGDTDLTSPHEVEGLRRSVAMLPANSYDRIFSREEALQVLESLSRALRAIPID